MDVVGSFGSMDEEDQTSHVLQPLLARPARPAPSQSTGSSLAFAGTASAAADAQSPMEARAQALMQQPVSGSEAAGDGQLPELERLPALAYRPMRLAALGSAVLTEPETKRTYSTRIPKVLKSVTPLSSSLPFQSFLNLPPVGPFIISTDPRVFPGTDVQVRLAPDAATAKKEDALWWQKWSPRAQSGQQQQQPDDDEVEQQQPQEDEAWGPAAADHAGMPPQPARSARPMLAIRLEYVIDGDSGDAALTLFNHSRTLRGRVADSTVYVSGRPLAPGDVGMQISAGDEIAFGEHGSVAFRVEAAPEPPSAATQALNLYGFDAILPLKYSPLFNSARCFPRQQQGLQGQQQKGSKQLLLQQQAPLQTGQHLASSVTAASSPSSFQQRARPLQQPYPPWQQQQYDPDDMKVLAELAARDPPQAASVLRELVRDYPDRPPLWILWAQACARMNLTSAARRLFRAAVEVAATSQAVNTGATGGVSGGLGIRPSGRRVFGLASTLGTISGTDSEVEEDYVRHTHAVNSTQLPSLQAAGQLGPAQMSVSQPQLVQPQHAQPQLLQPAQPLLASMPAGPTGPQQLPVVQPPMPAASVPLQPGMPVQAPAADPVQRYSWWLVQALGSWAKWEWRMKWYGAARHLFRAAIDEAASHPQGFEAASGGKLLQYWANQVRAAFICGHKFGRLC